MDVACIAHWTSLPEPSLATSTNDYTPLDANAALAAAPLRLGTNLSADRVRPVSETSESQPLQAVSPGTKTAHLRRHLRQREELVSEGSKAVLK